MHRSNPLVWSACAVGVTLWVMTAMGCSGSSPYASGDSGKALSRQPGAPLFDMEISNDEVDSVGGVTVYLTLARNSVTYFKSGTGFEAECAISARVLDGETRSMVTEKTWSTTLSARLYEETRRPSQIRFDKHVTTGPGKFVVEVEVEDRQSRKSLTHRQSVYVPDLGRGVPVLGKLLLLAPDQAGTLRPLTAFHIPAGADSLHFSTTAYNLSKWKHARVEILLSRFVVDSVAAAPPFTYVGVWPTETQAYRLMPSKSETTIVLSRDMAEVGPRIPFAGTLPLLRRGMYRLSVTIAPIDSSWQMGDTLLRVHRYFVITRPEFPRPTTLEEMTQMVRYLATDAEMRDLDSAKGDRERRLKFEKFWLNFTHDPMAAANLIRIYYARCEQANLLFSTFKEGWKTDRGMLTIVLGPPEYIERSFQRETWYYSMSASSEATMFQFRVVQFAPEDLSIDEYVLTRSMTYQISWDRIISKWREGEIF